MSEMCPNPGKLILALRESRPCLRCGGSGLRFDDTEEYSKDCNKCGGWGFEPKKDFEARKGGKGL